MTHNPDEIISYLISRYDARCIAGQPGHKRENVTALVGYANALRNAANPKLKYDWEFRVVAEDLAAATKRAEPYLDELVPGGSVSP